MTQYQAEKGAKEVKALQEEEARQKAQLEQLKKDNKELREKIGDEETAIDKRNRFNALVEEDQKWKEIVAAQRSDLGIIGLFFNDSSVAQLFFRSENQPREGEYRRCTDRIQHGGELAARIFRKVQDPVFNRAEQHGDAGREAEIHHGSGSAGSQANQQNIERNRRAQF